MAAAMPWLLWASQLKSEHKKLADQLKQDTEANAASAGVLKRDLKDLSASHNQLHEISATKDSVQSLSDSIAQLEKRCETRAQRNERRISTLEMEQRNLLNGINQIVQAEFADWKDQWTQAAAQTNERHRQEIDGLRRQMIEVYSTVQTQVE